MRPKAEKKLCMNFFFLKIAENFGNFENLVLNNKFSQEWYNNPG